LRSESRRVSPSTRRRLSCGSRSDRGSSTCRESSAAGFPLRLRAHAGCRARRTGRSGPAVSIAPQSEHTPGIRGGDQGTYSDPWHLVLWSLARSRAIEQRTTVLGPAIAFIATAGTHVMQRWKILLRQRLRHFSERNADSLHEKCATLQGARG